MNKTFFKVIISIVKNAFCENCDSLPNDFDFEKVYWFSMHQNIVVMMYYGIINSGVQLAEEINDKFLIAAGNSVARAERQMSEFNRITSAFDKNGIRFMPLKGSVIRSIYPKEEMRAMGDCDILIDTKQYNEIRPIMTELGYTEDVESNHELIWHHDSVCVELHKRLIPSYNKDYYAYFGDGWDRALTTESGSRYEMSSEDTLIYLVTHFAKHFRDAGIGIKHLVDIKLYLEQKELDLNYLERQSKQLKLWDFFNNIRKTVDVWFNDGQADEITDIITHKILSGGAFGTKEAHDVSDALKQRENGNDSSRLSKALKLVFLPYKNMCLLFPSLKKLPFLLPLYWVWRVLYTCFNKKGALLKHYNTIKELTPDRITQYKKELNAVGLDYRFEEED